MLSSQGSNGPRPEDIQVKLAPNDLHTGAAPYGTVLEVRCAARLDWLTGLIDFASQTVPAGYCHNTVVCSVFGGGGYRMAWLYEGANVRVAR